MRDDCVSCEYLVSCEPNPFGICDEFKVSKEKQIEEMAKDVTNSIVWDSDEYATVDCLATAKKLHLKGYRKQSEGEWVDMDYYIHNKRIYKCSECSNSEAKDTLTFANYCPKCGAKMKGGAE